MKKVHRRKCLDVSVMREADCNTDHRMLRAKVVVGRKVYFRKKHNGAGVKRWDVAKLQCTSEDARERERDCEGRVFELHWSKATGILECICQ